MPRGDCTSTPRQQATTLQRPPPTGPQSSILDHRLFYSLGTGIPRRNRPKRPPAGQVINQRWLKLGYPSYWHYDILAVLMFLARIGRIDDPRASRSSRPTRAQTPTGRRLGRRPTMVGTSGESLRPPT